MATVNLDYAQIWTPHANPFLHTSSSQSTARTVYKTSSRKQPAQVHGKADQILKHNARHQGNDFVAGAQGYETNFNHVDEADDDFPLAEEILRPISRLGIPTGDRNIRSIFDDLDKPAIDTSRSCISTKLSILDNIVGDNQGTQDRPVILEDDESEYPCDNPDPEATPVLANAAFKPGKPIDPSYHETWYDVDGACFVDQDLLPFPQDEAVVNVRGGRGTLGRGFANKKVRFADPPATEQNVDPFSKSSCLVTMSPFDTIAATSSSSPLRQEDLVLTPAQGQPYPHHHSPRPLQDWIDPCDNNRTTRSASEEQVACSLSALLGEEGEEQSDENICELEKDMLLTFEEQEKSSAGQGGKEPHEHEQEHDLGVMMEEEDDDGSQEMEQRGEKRRHQDGAEEDSSGIHQADSSDDRHEINGEDDEDDEDDKDPRPAKRRKLPPASTKDITPPYSRRLHIAAAPSPDGPGEQNLTMRRPRPITGTRQFPQMHEPLEVHPL